MIYLLIFSISEKHFKIEMNLVDCPYDVRKLTIKSGTSIREDQKWGLSYCNLLFINK